MAIRPIFIPKIDGDFLVKTENIEFEWFAGFSASQKRKSINSLHSVAKKIEGIENLLEISSKSENELGVALSAFNLMISTEKGKSVSVECVFQSSKVFEGDIQYLDLLDMASKKAKKDPRLKSSGRVIAFRTYGKREKEWQTTPITAYYDWIYINALNQHKEFHEELLKYSAFTDIEFNPEKSLNCQAYSVALFCSLYKRKVLDKVLKSQKAFLSIYKEYAVDNSYTSKKQPDLLL
ncbi:hypothetical protein [Neisseria dentiae]|uniref:DarT1-associated NADAR antitoxin family protein n=1 Tax=Neisseria dentiae TaxID=194197 RepID=UPI00359F2238